MSNQMCPNASECERPNFVAPMTIGLSKQELKRRAKNMRYVHTYRAKLRELNGAKQKPSGAKQKKKQK